MSRTIVHRAVDGEVVPGTYGAEDEIFGIARTLGELARESLNSRPPASRAKICRRGQGNRLDAPTLCGNGPTGSFALVQHDVAPKDWKRLLDLCDEAGEKDGSDLRPQ